VAARLCASTFVKLGTTADLAYVIRAFPPPRGRDRRVSPTRLHSTDFIEFALREQAPLA